MILSIAGYDGPVEDAQRLDALQLSGAASPRPESGNEFAVQSEDLYAIVTRVSHQNIILNLFLIVIGAGLPTWLSMTMPRGNLNCPPWKPSQPKANRNCP